MSYLRNRYAEDINSRLKFTFRGRAILNRRCLNRERKGGFAAVHSKDFTK